jgi:predicted glycogen debranching enzyme
MINIGPDICTNFEEASAREWLETNGIGGFACGSIAGANTRRYHGLLTAATRAPLGRITMLSKFEETLFIDGAAYELSSNQYPGTVHPEGFRYLTNFRVDPFPVWSYEIEGIRLKKKIFMVHGTNMAVCRWETEGDLQGRQVELELKPLLSFVDYHHLQHEDAGLDPEFRITDGAVTVRPYREMPALFFFHNAREVTKTGFWYRNFEYAIEKERGFDYTEDLFQPFSLRFPLHGGADVMVSTEDKGPLGADALESGELLRRAELIEAAGADDDFAMQLVLAADQFIVARGEGQTVIAGYPWFSDWGRDTMIALSGLTLATGRPETAKSILLEFSNHISQGMIPNRFPDAGDAAEYNTVDATLWYFEAIRAYGEKTGDYQFIHDRLYHKLAGIITWHLRGTRYNIHVDTDGLLYAGEPGVQLTWMDAKIGDLVITPRTGKAVEIQALWYNALKIMADLGGRFEDEASAAQYDAMAETARQSFNALFWNEDEKCLFDVIVNGHRDPSVRPNQIFAAGLYHSILDDETARKIVDKVETELLTPVGLRSLSPRDPAYVPIYTGSPFERDSAYHQGTVWGWLIGGFVDAYRRVYPGREERVAEILSGFKEHLTEGCIGQISEIFDAGAPHRPRGCFAQAWSVAELLRVLKKR